jgi:hypothetical protein
MSLLEKLLQLVMAKKPVALPIPAAPIVIKAVGRETRFKLPAGYVQGAMEVQQVTRGIPYRRLPDEFGGTHTDADSTVVVPGIGTDYPGEFRLRAAATATNQAGTELIIKNPAPTPAKPTSTATAISTPAPIVLPTPAAPTLVAVQNLDTRIQLPAGYRDINLIELEIS